MTCKCISYNDPQPWQSIQSDVLMLPEWVNGECRTVCVDACISQAVQALWDAKIMTQGSCCGHGNPELRSVIVDLSDRDKAVAFSADIDPTIRVAAWEHVYAKGDKG